MFDIVEPTDEQLTSLLLYGLPKTGKSTILADLTVKESNSLVISTDPKGYHFLKALANGAGYQYSREVMMEWFRKFQKIAERIILVAHVKDKRVESKLQDIVDVADINLTGKVKSIWSSVVDGIGFVYRDKEECYISFEAKQDVIAGCRLARLSNQNVMISDNKSFHWDKIYSDIKIK
jgi:hypothetical protein